MQAIHAIDIPGRIERNPKAGAFAREYARILRAWTAGGDRFLLNRFCAPNTGLLPEPERSAGRAVVRMLKAHGIWGQFPG